jgi:hypothetical protein
MPSRSKRDNAWQELWVLFFNRRKRDNGSGMGTRIREAGKINVMIANCQCLQLITR